MGISCVRPCAALRSCNLAPYAPLKCTSALDYQASASTKLGETETITPGGADTCGGQGIQPNDAADADGLSHVRNRENDHKSSPEDNPTQLGGDDRCTGSELGEGYSSRGGRAESSSRHGSRTSANHPDCGRDGGGGGGGGDSDIGRQGRAERARSSVGVSQRSKASSAGSGCGESKDSTTGSDTEERVNGRQSGVHQSDEGSISGGNRSFSLHRTRRSKPSGYS